MTAEQSSLCASDPSCKPSYSRLLDVWRSAPLRCGVRCLLAGRRARFSGAAPPLIDEHFAHARRDAGVRASAAESEERGRWCAQLKALHAAGDSVRVRGREALMDVLMDPWREVVSVGSPGVAQARCALLWRSSAAASRPASARRYAAGADGSGSPLGPPRVFPEHVPAPPPQTAGFSAIGGFGRGALGPLPAGYPEPATRLVLRDLRLLVQLCAPPDEPLAAPGARACALKEHCNALLRSVVPEVRCQAMHGLSQRAPCASALSGIAGAGVGSPAAPARVCVRGCKPGWG